MNPGWPPCAPPATGVPGTAAAVATTGRAVRLWALPPPPWGVPCSCRPPWWVSNPVAPGELCQPHPRAEEGQELSRGWSFVSGVRGGGRLGDLCWGPPRPRSCFGSPEAPHPVVFPHHLRPFPPVLDMATCPRGLAASSLSLSPGTLPPSILTKK